MKPRVLYTVLAHGGWIHSAHLEYYGRIATDNRVKMGRPFTPNHRPLDHARNFVVDYALENKYDYLLCFDHDNPCIRNPIDLCFMDKDIIFCPTPLVDQNTGKVVLNVEPVKSHIIGSDKILKGLFEIEKGGTGGFMMSRKAMQEIEKPMYKFTYDENGFWKEGEDWYFCRKAKEAGFKLWSHRDYLCSHFKELDLLGQLD